MGRFLWLVVSGLMMLSLVMVSCGPAAAPTTPTAPTSPAIPTAPTGPTTPTAEKPQQEAVKPAPETPKYGGTLVLSQSSDITQFDILVSQGGGPTKDLTNERPWDGDWVKGPAGGYGTNEATWAGSTTIPQFKTGYLAESVTWAIDPGEKEVTTTIKVRQGIRYALNPNSEASRLVNGREVTADDFVYNLDARMNDSRAMTYLFSPNMRGRHAVKSGPREVKVTLPIADHLSYIMRMTDGGLIYPREVMEKYGDMSNWKNSVGTGPFVLTEYVPASQAILVRNPNYWMKDPVGPGKGNQLPYLDSVRFLFIPDLSTRQAALRTAKIHQLSGFTLEDARLMEKAIPALRKAEASSTGVSPIQMRTDKAPFNDIRVRRAMMMTIDFEAINKSLYQGTGQILTWPYWYDKAYAVLYLGLDDPEMPASVKELYSYNPEKAKQLMKEAGYPSGFKTTILLTSTQVDYYSIIKDMFAKVGIDMTLDVREVTPLNNILDQQKHEALAAAAAPPNSSWPQAAGYSTVTRSNSSLINDPKVNEAVDRWNKLAITDWQGAMKQTKELMKYVLDQAWVIPAVRYPAYTFWWPWVKGYSGELTVGWVNSGWPRWVWMDQELKKSMGF